MNTETIKQAITVQTIVNAPVATVWEKWTTPADITRWCQASNDWHAPYADNDLRVDGRFKTTMAAKDGSFSFDFEGVYTEVKHHETIAYTMADGRTVRVDFEARNGATGVTETFEPESINDPEMQRAGWQAILDNFRKYVEDNA